jgi:dsDNA-binding SOS-regulon protein
MVVSSHTVLYNVMLEVADQWDGWMQKSVFQWSENTDNCLPALFASVY